MTAVAPERESPNTGATTGHSPAERQAREERRAVVATLLASGVTYRRIAAEVGVSISTVNSDAQAIRAAWRKRATASYEEFVSEAMAKLDLLESRVLPAALRVDRETGKPNLWAVDRALAIVDRRCTLLGLDKPVRPAPVSALVEVRGTVTHELRDDPASLADTLAGLLDAGVLDRVALARGAIDVGGEPPAEDDALHAPHPNGEATGAAPPPEP